jgi:hypothetical protein
MTRGEAGDYTVQEKILGSIAWTLGHLDHVAEVDSAAAVPKETAASRHAR